MLLFLLLYQGILNERKLAAAMDCWPRMLDKRPVYAAWQHSWKRTLVGTAIAVSAYATVIVAIEAGVVPWGLATAVVALTFAIPAQRWVRGWYRRRRQEITS